MVRAHGHRAAPDGLDEHGHACMVFDRDEQVGEAVAAYLADGLALGQRIACVGPNEEEMREAIAELDGAGDLIARGALVLLPIAAIYTDDGIDVDFEQRLGVYEAATEQALADGYTGLRVAALVTELVLDPVRWQKHIRWESYADHYMVSNPLSALCLYDARRLPREITRDLASVHPVTSGPCLNPPFRIYAGERGRSIDGELDFFDCDDLERLLVLTENRPDDAVLDLSALGFVDHRAMLAIEAYRRQAEAMGTELQIGESNPLVNRVAGLLKLPI